MRILSFLSIILINFLFAGHSFAKLDNTSKVFTLMKQRQWDTSYQLAVKTGDSALQKIVLSQQYLDNRHSGNSFKKITGFFKKILIGRKDIC